LDTKQQPDDLFAFNFEEGLKQIIKLTAEIFDFPLFQFELSVNGDKALQASLMQHGIEFYESALQRLSALSKDDSKNFEKSKLLRPILGKSEDEIQIMVKHMEDRYYR
jgi:hypothetical protein